MSIAKSILLLALAAALANYAVDCSAMNTPEQAMQCCGSMPCPPHHGNSEDCCKSMPSMHALFVQPAACAAHSTALFVLGILPAQFSIMTAVDLWRWNRLTTDEHSWTLMREQSEDKVESAAWDEA